jgi:hypothetical protein
MEGADGGRKVVRQAALDRSVHPLRTDSLNPFFLPVDSFHSLRPTSKKPFDSVGQPLSSVRLWIRSIVWIRQTMIAEFRNSFFAVELLIGCKPAINRAAK